MMAPTMMAPTTTSTTKTTSLSALSSSSLSTTTLLLLVTLLSTLILTDSTVHVDAFVQPSLPVHRRSVPGLFSTVKRQRVVAGPPKDTRPDYENIHGPLGKFADRVFMTVFRTKLAEHVGIDSSLPKDDFNGLIELTAALNARYSDRTEIQKRAQATLVSLFPSWMPSSYSVLFSKPFPKFSSRMNAWATWVAGQWLMGDCEINDIEYPDGTIGQDQGVLVKRCRFLEESGCASVCVNSCKIPTQNFFANDMGLPLTMTPDYETHECQFAFGVLPTEQSELDAKQTPCLARCPSVGALRKLHSGHDTERVVQEKVVVVPVNNDGTVGIDGIVSRPCDQMESGPDATR